jgi:hypothetical protein
MLRQSLVRSVVLVTLIGASFACGNAPTPTTSPSTVLIQTAPEETPASCMAALLQGRLVLSPAGSIEVVDPGGALRSVIWPPGYSARRNGSIAIIDEHGDVVAHVGDTIEAGGGHVGPAESWKICPGTIVAKDGAALP